jgi:hypothetical protein
VATKTYTDAESVTIKEKLEVIEAALSSLDSQLGSLRYEVEKLEQAGICTGVVHWRDAGADDRLSKLYANHGIDEPCPLHGRPDPGKRLRIYVGADPEEQKKILAAMERRKQKLSLEKEIHQIEEQQDRIEWRVSDAYHAAIQVMEE